MKYFYTSIFFIVILLRGYSQVSLNTISNVSQPGEVSILFSNSGTQNESVVAGVNATVPLKNNVLFNPNPATNNIRIGYSIASCTKVSLSVFNQIGQEVLSFVKEYQKEGNYYLDADISKLLPGIYFIRLNAGKEIITKKLLVN